MQKKLTLSIPQPCHEDWNKMNPTEKGRFCSSCQKEVIDFTMMTDRELYQFFTKNQHKTVCGQTLQSQLNTAIAMPVEPKKKKLWYLNYLATLLLLINKSETKAQVKQPVTTSPVDLQPLRGLMAPKINKANVVEGQVVDSSGIPIPYASVTVKGTKVGVAADGDGKFSIKTNIFRYYKSPQLDSSPARFGLMMLTC